jgi:hypothetical protein
MEYLNRACIEGISSDAFRTTQPYPWVNATGTLLPEAFETLRQTLPDASTFIKHENKKRGYGQAPHNRYILHYLPGMQLAKPWQEFVGELLHGDTYQSFLRRMLGPHKFILTLEWYYAWHGCSVSPHCDAKRKLATHIFYFNTEKDWQPDWGGKILMLDDDKKWKAHSAPGFDELRVAASLNPWGNASLFFQRTPHSWHGVRPLECPPDTLRKLFIVTVNVPTFQVWWRGVRGKDPDGYRLSQ